MQEKGFWDGAKAATPTVFGYISIVMALGIVGLVVLSYLHLIDMTLRPLLLSSIYYGNSNE